MRFLKRIREKKLFRKEISGSAESVPFQMLEALEPRLLLSADMSLTALAGESLDLTLRLNGDRQEIQIVDNTNQSVLRSQPYAETRSVLIEGADQDDTCRFVRTQLLQKILGCDHCVEKNVRRTASHRSRQMVDRAHPSQRFPNVLSRIEIPHRKVNTRVGKLPR